MRDTFGYSLRQIAVACFFSGLIAAGVSALTNSSAADYAPAVSVSINRTIKSDRLRPAPEPQRPMDNSGAMGAVRFPKPTLGCEPAFSRIADPAHADIVRDCLA